MILPGSVIGVLGSGQLGRMFALAARALGYRIHIFSPEQDPPAGQVADREFVAAYEDEQALREFARGVSVVTFEFENIPVQSTDVVAQCTTVRPRGQVLHTTQNRLREKTFLRDRGIPVAPFAPVGDLSELRGAVELVGCPGVLKTAECGYDGKGQVKLLPGEDLEEVWGRFGQRQAVYESFIPFERELSVVAARTVDGMVSTFPVFENTHARHILDTTVCPAQVDQEVAARAREIAGQILEVLDVVGLLTVEFFLAPGGVVLVNELAPRTHNSGHLTVDACETSQFEQQVRAVCGLPLGATELQQPAAMANLLGEIWSRGEPDWAAALQDPRVKLHLYGKAEARPGRKMGHFTACATTVEEARQAVVRARERLIKAS